MADLFFDSFSKDNKGIYICLFNYCQIQDNATSELNFAEESFILNEVMKECRNELEGVQLDMYPKRAVYMYKLSLFSDQFRFVKKDGRIIFKRCFWYKSLYRL